MDCYRNVAVYERKQAIVPRLCLIWLRCRKLVEYGFIFVSGCTVALQYVTLQLRVQEKNKIDQIKFVLLFSEAKQCGNMSGGLLNDDLHNNRIIPLLVLLLSSDHMH